MRARSRGCFLPGKRDLQDLTDLSDLSDLSDIQDRLTPCQAIQHNTLSNNTAKHPVKPKALLQSIKDNRTKRRIQQFGVPNLTHQSSISSARAPFGTATQPIGASEPSPRGKGGLLTVLRHGDPTHRYPRDIHAWQTGTEPMPNRSMNGAMGTLRHGDLAHRYFRAIRAWRRGSSDRSSARHPCPQVSQSHLRVAKRSSDRSSARPPRPQVPQGHPRGATVSWCFG